MKPRTGYQIVKANTTAALQALVAGDGKAEYRLQCQIVELLKTCGTPGLVFFHVPNGGKRHAREAARFKAMGVLAGVSDLVLSIPSNGIFFMEIKSGKGRVSPEQQAFLDAMDDHEHTTAVVRSFEQAVDLLTGWGAIEKARVAA